MTARPKPHIHARDHEHGGADTIRIHYEKVGTDSGGGGGGIQFDTKPQAGDWLYIETDDVDPSSGNIGIQLNADGHDLELIAGNDTKVFSGRDTVWSADRDVTVNADREIDIVAATDIFMRVNNGGAGGNLILRNLPTSDPGISGAVWNDAGALKVSP